MKRRLFLALVFGALAVGLWLYLRETMNEKVGRWAREQHGPWHWPPLAAT